MKRFLKLFLAFAIFIGSIVIPINKSYASNDIKVLLDGKELVFDVPPQIIEGRTLLPLRAIFEALGLEVGWDNETRTITGISEGKEIILKLDSKEAKVNGINKALDVPAKSINGRTLVPVRFIAEGLNLNVVWNQESRTVKISKDDIIEWKYAGYEGAYPHKEYEKKFVNGVETSETRYNGKNHEFPEEKEEKIVYKEPLVLIEKNMYKYEAAGDGISLKWSELYKYGIEPNIIGTPELTILVMNTSGKDIDAFEFEAKLFDSFDRPVNKLGTDSNIFRGIAQNLLLSKDDPTYSLDYPWDAFTWNLALYDLATKVKDVKIMKVHFTDGTIWNRQL